MVVSLSDWIVIGALAINVVLTAVITLESRRIRKRQVVKIEWGPTATSDGAAVTAELEKQARDDRRWP